MLLPAKAKFPTESATSAQFFLIAGIAVLQKSLDRDTIYGGENLMTTPPSTRQAVTQLLGEWSNGDEGALEKLIPLVHPELHRLAHHYMSRERAGHTLQTTARSQRSLPAAG